MSISEMSEATCGTANRGKLAPMPASLGFLLDGFSDSKCNAVRKLRTENAQ